MSDIKKFEPLWGVWQVEDTLGEGSFGKVYKAVREEFGVKYYCAIKHISIPKSEEEVRQYMDESMSDDRNAASAYFKQIVKNVTDEISIMYSLKGNSNIVSYEEHLVLPKADGIGYDIFIKMELLTDLPKKVKESFSQNDVIKLGVDLCSALELCAAKRLIHRDIKPQNIFVSKEGNYKLGDFGISRLLEKTSGGLSKKGTVSYMAPEVYKGEEYGANVDIYSLGLVLYRLLNDNRLPFLPPVPAVADFNDNEAAMQRRMKGEAIPAPRNAPPDLANIILKMCAYDRKTRYANPAHVKRDLLALNLSENGVSLISGLDTTMSDTKEKDSYIEETVDIHHMNSLGSSGDAGKKEKPIPVPIPELPPVPQTPPEPIIYTPPQPPVNPNPYNQTPFNQQYPQYQYQAKPGKSNATTSLVCGILSIVLCMTVIGGIALGIVAVIQALSAKKKNHPATGGLVTGVIGLILTALMLLLVIIGILAPTDDNNGYTGNNSNPSPGTSQSSTPSKENGFDSWTISTHENSEGGYSFDYSPKFGVPVNTGVQTTINNLTTGSDISVNRWDGEVLLESITKETYADLMKESGYEITDYYRFEHTTHNGNEALIMLFKAEVSGTSGLIYQMMVNKDDYRYMISCGDVTKDTRYTYIGFRDGFSYFEYVMDSFEIK